MTVFSYETELSAIKFSSNLEEKDIHSYNESSAIYIVDEDFGSITASVDAEEDYGSIVDNPTGNSIDYGLITITETLVPYGPINISNNDVATLKLVRVGISNVTFSILGQAFIFTTPIEKGSGRIRINGTSGDPRFSLAHVGTGSLFALSSSTEVKGSNPPEETVLFRFTGSAVERIADAHVGSGSLFTFTSKTESSSSVEQAQGLFRVTGSAVPSASLSHIGSGRIFGFTGSSEAVTDVPLVSTALYRIVGTADENFIRNYAGITEGEFFTHESANTLFSLKHIGSGNLNLEGTVSESITPAPHIGSGRIFAFTGSSESTAVDPPDLTTLFEISGDANYKLTSAHLSKVNLDVEGRATTIFRLSHVGSGSLFGFFGANEAIFADPLEKTALFRIAGSAIEKNTEAYRGSGSLFGFSSTTESSSNVESVKGLFRISGRVRDIFVLNNIGTGSLFGFSSATESIAVNPPEETVLFKFTGSAIEKNTESYRGSGSLFGFSSTTEAVGANPPEFIPVLRFSGTAAESFVPAPHIAAGSLFAFGSATETRSVSPQASGVFRFTGSVVQRKTNSFAGSGSLFGFSSTAESFAITPSPFAPLFKISGTVAESFIPAPHIGSGALRAFSSATETRAVFPKSNVLFEFHGNTVERSTRSQLGSGSLFGITGSYEATEVIPKIAGVLFTLFGFVGESYTPATEIASGITVLRGASTDRKVVFVPAKPTRIIII
jgi:hypothetical protein